MQAVAETHAFRRAAAEAGMRESEVDCLVTLLAENPALGDPIPGTGGCRKLRLPMPGKGKSGGYRVVTFFSGETLPVFLLTVFAKGERSDLSYAERNRLGALTKAIVSEYRARVARSSIRGPQK